MFHVFNNHSIPPSFAAREDTDSKGFVMWKSLNAYG